MSWDNFICRLDIKINPSGLYTKKLKMVFIYFVSTTPLCDNIRNSCLINTKVTIFIGLKIFFLINYKLLQPAAPTPHSIKVPLIFQLPFCTDDNLHFFTSLNASDKPPELPRGVMGTKFQYILYTDIIRIISIS